MNISFTDLTGIITDASLKVASPGKTMDSSQHTQTKGENADVRPEQVKQMVAEMQDHLDSMHVSLQYYFYGSHNEKIAIKVVNKETGAVIREIPPKEIQSLQAKMSELCGMIFNGKG